MAVNSTNNATATCPYDSVFERVANPDTYNWTSAWDQYHDEWTGRTHALGNLFRTRVGDKWIGLPGCWYLGVLDNERAKKCEEGGGMAVVATRSKDIVDADVWYCGIPGTSDQVPAPNPISDDYFSLMKSNVSENPLICNRPDQNESDAPHRAVLSHWLPLLAVALTSAVALL